MAQATKEGPSDPARVCPPKDVGLEHGALWNRTFRSGAHGRHRPVFCRTSTTFQQCPRV